MLYRKMISVCSETRTKHIDTLCEHKVEYFNIKSGGIYSNYGGFYWEYVFIWVFCSLHYFCFFLLLLLLTVLVSSSFLSDCYYSNLAANIATIFSLASAWLTGESDRNSSRSKKFLRIFFRASKTGSALCEFLLREAYRDVTNRMNMRHTNKYTQL
jgi:hypothetical protein